MTTIVPKKNPLEESLSKLDLQATLVLLTVLSQRALMLQQEQLKNTKVDKLLKPSSQSLIGVTPSTTATAIKIPLSIHKPIEL